MGLLFYTGEKTLSCTHLKKLDEFFEGYNSLDIK